MKTNRRWMRAALEASKCETTPLPWTRSPERKQRLKRVAARLVSTK